MIIYVRHNTTRKEKFRLMTTFEKENDSLFVYKKAYSNEGNDFLKHFVYKYNELKKLNLPFEISEPRNTNEGVQFPFVDGNNLVDRVLNTVQTADVTSVKKAIQTFIAEIIKKLPEQNYIESSERDEIFGSFDPNQKYTIGLADLAMDNMIISNDTYTLIDFEWFFDFALPVDFIIFRMLKSLITFTLPGKGIHLKELDEVLKVYMKEEFILAEYNMNKYILKDRNISPWEDFLADHLNFKTFMPEVKNIIQEKNNISIQRLNYIHELITKNEELTKIIERQKRELNRRVVKIALKARKKFKQITGK